MKSKFSEKITYLVCHEIEAHATGIEGGSLLGIADPEANMIKAIELANCGLNKKKVG